VARRRFSPAHLDLFPSVRACAKRSRPSPPACMPRLTAPWFSSVPRVPPRPDSAHVFPCQCTLTQSRLWQHHSSRCCTNATMRSSRPLSPTCLVLIYPVPSGDIFPFPNKVTALLSLGELELPMPLPHATVPPPCADHRAPALLQPPDRACLHSAPETT
jgi:hypothetical protein